MSGFFSAAQDAVEPASTEPIVLDLESEQAGAVLAALSSATARDIVKALHDEPATLSAVADRVDTSRQNAQYHLKQLQAVDAVTVIDTLYSEKGREMKVYAPAGEPLVIVSGDDDAGDRLRDVVSGMLAPLFGLGAIAAGIQVLATRHDSGAVEPESLDDVVNVGGTAGPETDSFEVHTGYADGEEVTLEEPITIDFADSGQALWEAYPGLIFFLGALAAFGILTVWQWYR